MLKNIWKNAVRKRALNTSIIHSTGLTTTQINSTQSKGKKNYKRKKQQRQPVEPMARAWQTCNANTENLNKYKLVSYNILAQDLLIEHLHLYINTNPHLLRWEHRLRRLKEELLDLNADILCLQEMQYNHLKHLVREIKGNRCLEYVFKKKTGHRTDGCAIIYDKSKFQLIKHLGIEYHTPGHHILNRENIALFATFDLKEEPGKKLIVATTHLLYNPKREDVRIAQVNMLLTALKDFSNAYQNEETKLYPSVILTGDFNFQPFTHPYALVVSPSLNLLNNMCTLVKENTVENNIELLPLNFGNACASTFQDSWITVDHIFYSIHKNCNNIKILEILRLPSIQDCEMFGYIPNRLLGSDHYSLAINFSIE